MQKKVTSHDVAREAGVSQTAVSFVLNNTKGKSIKPETRQRILDAAHKLGYHVNINAKNMRQQRAGAIGVISEWAISSFVFAPLVEGIKSVCGKRDLSIVLCTGKQDGNGEYDFKKYFMQNRIDGVILISYVGINKTGIISELIDSGIPFVCVKGAKDIETVSSVDVDYTQSTRLAVGRLAEGGCKRICYILKNKPDKLNYAERERLAACIEMSKELGIELILYEGFIGCMDTEDYNKSADALIGSGIKFDAFLSTSFECCCMMRRCAGHGIRIPEDLSVMSLDNESYADFLYPPLTTTDEPLFEMGSEAMQMLLLHMGSDSAPNKKEMPAAITVRQSTK